MIIIKPLIFPIHEKLKMSIIQREVITTSEYYKSILDLM